MYKMDEEPLMDLRAYLDEKDIHYHWYEHVDACAAQEKARGQCQPGCIVKTVLVTADGEFILCSLPACYRLDLDQLRATLGAKHVEIASEQDMVKLIDASQLGPEPPIGWLFGLPTLMDESLCSGYHVTIPAGAGNCVTLSFLDYYNLARPTVGNVARPADLTPENLPCLAFKDPEACPRRKQPQDAREAETAHS